MSQGSWFHDTSWSMLRVKGADRVDFLNRLTTNTLPPSESPLVHNFFLSVNARIQAEFWVSALPDSLVLFTPTEQVEELKGCIDRYHFGEKISVEEPDGELFVICCGKNELSESPAEVFSPDPRYGDDCCWCFVPPDSIEAFRQAHCQDSLQMPTAVAERRRVSLGRPKFGTDYDNETLFVEVAQKDDFSETKGCYPGQEIVARVLHRGRLNKHLRGFRSKETISPGWHLNIDGKTVASVKSTVETEDGASMGYLLVRRQYGTEGESLTGVDNSGKEQTLTVVARAGEVLTGDEE